eukprot:6272113-Pyramimonas_sp.AAC.1
MQRTALAQRRYRSRVASLYMRGTNVRNAGVTNVVNTRDSQEQAPCATYGFLSFYRSGESNTTLPLFEKSPAFREIFSEEVSLRVTLTFVC